MTDIEAIRARAEAAHVGPILGPAVDEFIAHAHDDVAALLAVDRRPRAVDEPREVERAERLHRLAHEGGEAGGQGHEACSAAWGPYAPAVQRWAIILGRCVPPPVDDKRRLNPRAVEWMMGFVDGWVCDVLERRTDALRCLGNAVVQQQAVEALRRLSTQGAPQ